VSELVLPERVRLRYEKVGRVRFTSQRDLARIMERAMRRAALPVRRSAGFSPHPLVSFGLALPTGCASLAEYLDVRLDAEATGGAMRIVEAAEADRGSLVALCAQLTAVLPEGIAVTAAAALRGPEPSLQEAVTSCDWELEVLGVSPAMMAERVGRLLAADTVPVARERKGRTVTDDIRPNVLSLRASEAALREVGGLGDVVGLAAELSTKPRGVRPAELCRALGEDVTLLGACRTRQWIVSEDPTAREEPLTAAGVLAGSPARTEVQGG
jgi:radical SAM-linked protein